MGDSVKCVKDSTIIDNEKEFIMGEIAHEGLHLLFNKKSGFFNRDEHLIDPDRDGQPGVRQDWSN